MIFEDNDSLDQPDTNLDTTDTQPYYKPSLSTRKQIEKLLSEEKALQGKPWSYWENLRKTDPAEYWKPKNQVTMHHAAEALGPDFNDLEDTNG
jgi:hypothetical protein